MFWRRMNPSMRLGFTALLVSLLFFGWDILADIVEHITLEKAYSVAQFTHLVFETVALLSLIYALAVLKRHHELMEDRTAKAESTVAVYQEGADVLLQRKLDEVQLTPAEKEISVFIIKGLSPGEIAELRGTAVGTVKTQTTSIYRKMGVKNRSELLSQLIDEILDLDSLEMVISDSEKSDSA